MPLSHLWSQLDRTKLLAESRKKRSREQITMQLAPDFSVVVTRIQNHLACSKDMAKEYASAIGSNPEIINGKIVLRNEQKRIIAHVPASVLEPK
jgi:hypothetical protein